MTDSTTASQAVLDATRAGKDPAKAARAAMKPSGRRAQGSFAETLAPLEAAIAAVRKAEQAQDGLGIALDQFDAVAASTAKAISQQRDQIQRLIKSLGL